MTGELNALRAAALERAKADRGGSWKPSEEHLALFPPESGNRINGVGECDRRRPTVVYWDDPASLPHGRLQKYFYDQYFSVPEIKEAYFRGRGPGELANVAPTRVHRLAEEWTAAVKEKALELGCEMVGIARMRPEWVYAGREVAEPWIIMLGLAMDQPRLATAPSTPDDPTSAVEVAVNLARITRVSNSIAGWIRSNGWEAEPRPGPRPSGAMTLIPAAIACGFGELGKHGSLIHPVYGSSFRLAAVTTTIPRSSNRIRVRRFLRVVQCVRQGLPAGRHKQREAIGPRRNQVVRRLRQMRAVLQRSLWLRNLHRRVPVEHPWRRSTACGEAIGQA